MQDSEQRKSFFLLNLLGRNELRDACSSAHTALPCEVCLSLFIREINFVRHGYWNVRQISVLHLAFSCFISGR